MASSEPIPLYFFRRIPSEKKYSPGASEVAASKDPIITKIKREIRRIKELSFNPTVEMIKMVMGKLLKVCFISRALNKCKQIYDIDRVNWKGTMGQIFLFPTYAGIT